MRIYISGPMTGMPDHNRAAFDAAAKRLREQGHFVINPIEIAEKFAPIGEVDASFAAMSIPMLPGDAQRATALAKMVMSVDIAAVRSCDAIYMLKGWEHSRGAKKELDEAIAKANLGD